jgi:hypothetical protein
MYENFFFGFPVVMPDNRESAILSFIFLKFDPKRNEGWPYRPLISHYYILPLLIHLIVWSIKDAVISVWD